MRRPISCLHVDLIEALELSSEELTVGQNWTEKSIIEQHVRVKVHIYTWKHSADALQSDKHLLIRFAFM